MSAVASTASERKRDRCFPPKRGGVKAQIFESFKKTVVSAVSALTGNRGDGTAAGTPPTSTYNSDGTSEIA